MKTLTLRPLLSDHALSSKEGHYFPLAHYSTLITTSHDIYGHLDTPDTPPILLCKFRKNVLPQAICTSAFHALYAHAKQPNYNRGAASGILSAAKLPRYAQSITRRQSFRAYYTNKRTRTLKKDHISNTAMSNIAGYYDRPDRNLFGARTSHKRHPPQCRTTHFTAKEVAKWNAVVPLLRAADGLFKRLVPTAHRRQYKRASLTPQYRIDNTAFSTITANYNWRTACHKDRGDYIEGFGNLIILEKAKCIAADRDDGNMGYEGGYIGFPKWGVAIDVRQGDFLAMDVHQWHCNTELKTKNKKKDYGRLSIVCYLRHGMAHCAK
jgi:hypothetical protein